MGITNDSSNTNLRIAEEALNTPGVLPGTPVWLPYEPNSYGEFGGNTSTTARAPIAADRQKRKGSITGLDAVAGFNSDFTSKGLFELLQGFMYASWRKKDELAVTAVTGTGYSVASGGAAFPTGSLVFAEGFSTAANNGLKVAGVSTGTSVLASGLTAEGAPPAGAKVTRVGRQFAAAGLTLAVDEDGVATLSDAASDLNTLGVIPGEWFWVGGDLAAESFAGANNNGFYRARTVAAGSIVCDRFPTGAATDAGTDKTMRVYVGHVIKNEADPALQVKRTYQAERRLATGQLQYVKALAPNTLAIDVKTGGLITVDVGMVGLDEEFASVEKTGTRPALPANVAAFSSATDFTRLRLLNDTASSDLATYLTDLKLSIDNGVTPAMAIGSVGGIDLTTGDFAVAGSVEAYFATTAACQAVRDNADVAMDFALVAKAGGVAQGYLFDVPLITLGDGRLKVEKDKPVKLPLSMDAAAHGVLNHTLLVVNFPYLPNAAA